ncbi:MAG: hypothetical protein PHU80_10780 [Kiritimatiellae bacterium]|nr:hypothetical protein [Kiritimatiellia bacterium]
MRELSRNVFDHMPGPLGKPIWQTWIEDGTARVKTKKREVQKCQTPV